MLKSAKMLTVVPLIMWTAISACIYSSIFMLLFRRTIAADETYNDIDDIENFVNYMGFFILIVLGIGGIIGSYIMAYVKDNSEPRMPVLLLIA